MADFASDVMLGLLGCQTLRAFDGHFQLADVSVCKSLAQAIAFDFASVQSRDCRRFRLKMQFFKVQHEYV